MAKNKLKVSFAEFLSSGVLGPIAIGVPMRAVGECMGPPKYWSHVLDSPDIPNFWGFDHLEIRFSDRRPYKIEWMKLARADELRGARVSIGRNLTLDMNGVDGRMRPSEFVRSDIWSIDELDIDIQLIASELQLRIGHFPVEMLYVVPEDDSLDLSVAMAAFGEANWQVLGAFFNKKATLHGISAFSKAGWKGRHWHAPILKIGAREYVNTTNDGASVRD